MSFSFQSNTDMENRNHRKADGFSVSTVSAFIVGLGILSAAIYWINFRFNDLFPLFPGIENLQLFVILSLFSSLLYLIAIFFIKRMNVNEKTPWQLTVIIIFAAIIFRLGLIASDPSVLSNDMYRYIWDGRIQQRGINPYLYPPSAPELESLRDDRIFPNINRKDYPTIYPAGAQVFFRIIHILVGNSVAGFKGILVIFDLLTMLLLIAMLRIWGLNVARIIVYAWNPLVIFETAYSGHLEGVTVFLMVAAFYLYSTHKKFPAIIVLALSAAVKIYPALLLGALLTHGEKVKGIFIFAATIFLLYLPFIGAGGRIAGFLPVYMANPYENFNLGLKYFLMRLIPGLNYHLLSWLFIGVMAIAGLVVFLKVKKGPAHLRYAYVLTGLLLVLMPASLHPWYVITIIPFLVFYLNPAWLIFSCTVCLSYLKYTSPQGVMPTWILLTEYLPLFVLLAAGLILRLFSEKCNLTRLFSTGKRSGLTEARR